MQKMHKKTLTGEGNSAILNEENNLVNSFPRYFV